MYYTLKSSQNARLYIAGDSSSNEAKEEDTVLQGTLRQAFTISSSAMSQDDVISTLQEAARMFCPAFDVHFQ